MIFTIGLVYKEGNRINFKLFNSFNSFNNLRASFIHMKILLEFFHNK